MRAIDNQAIRAAGATRFRTEYDYAVFEYLRSAKVIEAVERAGVRIAGRILDAGCGGGGTVVSLAEESRFAVGLDIEPRFEQAGTRLGAEKAIHNASFLRGDAASLPFRDGCFDSTVATFPSEYILDQATLRGVARVLRLEGRLVVAGGIFLSGWAPLSRFIWSLYRIAGQGDVLADQAKTMLARAGFSMRMTWEKAKYNSRVLLVIAEKDQRPARE